MFASSTLQHQPYLLTLILTKEYKLSQLRLVSACPCKEKNAALLRMKIRLLYCACVHLQGIFLKKNRRTTARGTRESRSFGSQRKLRSRGCSLLETKDDKWIGPSARDGDNERQSEDTARASPHAALHPRK